MLYPSIIGVLLLHSQSSECVSSGQGYYNSMQKGYQQNVYSNFAPYNSIQAPTWSGWSNFFPCSVTCGTGFQKRERVCVGQPSPQNLVCMGQSQETISCYAPACYSNNNNLQKNAFLNQPVWKDSQQPLQQSIPSLPVTSSTTTMASPTTTTSTISYTILTTTASPSTIKAVSHFEIYNSTTKGAFSTISKATTTTTPTSTVSPITITPPPPPPPITTTLSATTKTPPPPLTITTTTATTNTPLKNITSPAITTQPKIITTTPTTVNTTMLTTTITTSTMMTATITTSTMMITTTTTTTTTTTSTTTTSCIGNNNTACTLANDYDSGYNIGQQRSMFNTKDELSNNQTNFQASTNGTKLTTTNNTFQMPRARSLFNSDDDEMPQASSSPSNNTAPVDGAWSEWVEFESCSLTCDGGMLGRSRLCVNPHPQNGGKECEGNFIEHQDCNTQPCPKDTSSSVAASSNVGATNQVNVANNNATMNNIPSSSNLSQNVFQNQDLATNSSALALSTKLSEFNQNVHQTGGTNISTFTNTFNGMPVSNQNVATSNNQLQVFNNSQSNFTQTVLNPLSLINNSKTSHDQNLSNQIAITNTATSSSNLNTTNNNLNLNTGSGQNTVSSFSGVNQNKNAANQNIASGSSNTLINQNTMSQVLSSNQNTMSQVLSSNQNKNTVMSNQSVANNNLNQLTTNNISQTNSNAVSWGKWSNYLSCSVSCGQGLMIRNRTCLHPDGEYTCEGHSIEAKYCQQPPCPQNQDGNWGPWSSYDGCTVTCGSGGTRTRRRTCNNPAPVNEGQDCVGSNQDVGACSFLPCRPSICSTTIYVKDNGSFACGFYLDKGKSWTEANVECKLRGARLPEISSAQENKDIFDRKPISEVFNEYDGLWIGLSRTSDGSNLFHWSSAPQQLTNYSNWSPGQPDNNLGIENCVHMWQHEGQWNDAECATPEFEPHQSTMCEVLF